MGTAHVKYTKTLFKLSLKMICSKLPIQNENIKQHNATVGSEGSSAGNIQQETQ